MSNELESALKRDVSYLAETLGERHLECPSQLAAAADWLDKTFQDLGYAVKRQAFPVDSQIAENIEATLPGTSAPDQIIVVGAHYDTVPTTPGADDNASGVAALLAIARAFATKKVAKTIRFVAFVNEEWPHFQSETMGSLVYAQACLRLHENIVGMMSLESLGYYSDAPGSQQAPVPELAHLVPDRGNFLALVGNPQSAPFLEQFSQAFRDASQFPMLAVAIPDAIRGAGWSDHWSFWKAGYPALMATDTALFRNPHYHEPSDLPATLSFSKLAEVTLGISNALEVLAST